MDQLWQYCSSESEDETGKDENEKEQQLMSNNSLTAMPMSMKAKNIQDGIVMPITRSDAVTDLDIKLPKGEESHKDVDFFGIDDSDSSSNEDEQRKTVDTKDIAKGIPNTQFWSGSDQKQDWSKPNEIWKVNSDKKDIRLPSKGRKQTISHNDSSEPKEQIKIYRPKRIKLNEKTSDTETNNSRPLQKSCFYVHHKITPLLHQKITSKVPSGKSPRKIELQGHSGIINRIRWNKDQFSHLLMSVSMDRTVKIWNVFSNIDKCVQIFSHHNKAVKDCQWIDSGRQILTCSYDKTVKLFDVEKGQQISNFEQTSFATCLAVHPQNPNFFIVGCSSSLQCWDKRCTTKIFKKYIYKDKFGQVQDVIFMKDGSQFFICTDSVTRDSADRNIMAWDFNTGVVLSNQIYQERYTCTRLCMNPVEQEFMAQTNGNYIALFSTIRPYKMNKCKRYDSHKVQGYNIGCDFSPDGQLIVSGSSYGGTLIYDYRSASIRQRLSVPSGDICTDVAWHPVLPSTVASATDLGTVFVWL